MFRLFPNPFAILKRRTNAPSEKDNEYQIAKRLSPGKAVLSGPFQGLQYPDYISYGSALIPKLLGTYEKELHPWISDIICKRYRRIINIGCAEGYYSVGLAVQIPKSTVWAFDVDPEALDFCKKMAQVNNVYERMHIRLMPNTSTLKKLLVKNSFIFSDCEGDEMLYFDPKKFPELVACSFLVELHEIKHPHEKAEFVEKFHRTHTIKIVRACERKLVDVPIGLRQCIRGSEITALNEFRNDGYTWMYAQPNTHSAGHN